jgi:RNA polymerase sigma-70 factor (ECF subfamily)
MAGMITISKLDARLESRDKRDAQLEALVRKAMQGDSNALYSLCEKLAKGVLYRTRYMLGHEMDAEDVSQNILTRVCENIQSLREPKAFRAWLAGIELNESRRLMSDNAKRAKVVDINDYLELLFEDYADRLPDRSAEEKDIRRSVMEILSCLPLRQREAVMLRYFEDLNVTEIARAMKITHQCVSRYLAIAREKLRAEIEAFLGAPPINCTRPL